MLAQTSKTVMAKCPNTKIVLGGYSQGAMQVHQALGQLGSDASKIAVCIQSILITKYLLTLVCRQR